MIFSPKKHNKASSIAIGFSAQREAETYLLAKGLSTLSQNFNCKCGEIDLIMKHEDTLVFVEVRFRKSARFGSALESVTPKKQQKIILAAQYYMQKNALPATTTAFRFDVVGITGKNIQWIPSAFGSH